MNGSMTDIINSTAMSREVANMSTVVPIVVDKTCPPYTHKVEYLCFTVPTMTSVAQEGCTCISAGMTIYNLPFKYGHEHALFQIEDRFIRKYVRLLKDTQSLSVNEELIMMFIVQFRGLKVLLDPLQRPQYDLRKLSDEDGSNYKWMELCYLSETTVTTQCPYGFTTCKDETCIVETSRCHGVIDCVDGNDELNCSFICTHPHPVTMCTLCNIADDCICHSLYFQCSAGGCVSATAICDGLMSCTDGSDELMCTPALPELRSCETDADNICHSFTKEMSTFSTICVYSRPVQSHHLVQKCEEWECSSMKTCKAAYCVPVHYICDNICDYPKCDDEAICMADNARDFKLSCPGMVKCKSGYPCVHSHHVQDGDAQCMYTHDDEVHYPHCPENCTCHITSIYCASFTHVSPPDIVKFTAVSAASNQLDSLTSLSNMLIMCQLKCPLVSYSDISNISGWETSLFSATVANIADVRILNVSHNPIFILSVTLMTHFHRILQLYLHHCNIYKIEVGIFVGRSLHILDLSHNKLNIINDRSFWQMHNLKYIFLQNNYIHTIDLKVFQEDLQLSSMDLRDNRILSIWLDPARWTSNAQLKRLYSDELILCCIIPATESCFPLASVFQSCSSLLINLYNKIILGSIGTITFVLNVVVFAYIVLWKSQEKNAKMRQIISSSVHAITDAFYGLHSIGLVTADIIYGEDFGKHMALWKRSLSCALLESCLSYSIIMSSILIIHMCVVLLTSITDISSQISEKRYKLSVLGLSVSCAMLIFAIKLIMVNLQTFEFNTFCFPLITEAMTSKLLINMAFEWIMLSANIILFLLSIAGLTSIILFVHKQQKLMKGVTSSKPSSNMTIKLQLHIGLVVTSRLVLHITWFAMLLGLVISPEVLVLLVLCPLAVWPVCHPFIHTFRIKWN